MASFINITSRIPPVTKPDTVMPRETLFINLLLLRNRLKNNKKDRKKISIVGQNFQDTDYLFTNFISEVDKNKSRDRANPRNRANKDCK